jgi:Ser/Thr protein kinase RdoA (MazF antagonist)
MNESSFPVQRSLLSAPALAGRVLANYDLCAPLTCQFWHRSINDQYLVRAGETKYVLRVSPTAWRPYEHLAAEIDLLNFLRQNRIIVPQPVQQKNGSYIQTLDAPEGPRYAVLFTFVPGAPPRPTEAHSYRYGQAIAQLHAVTNDYPVRQTGFRFEPADMVDEPLARLRPLFADHQDDFDYLLSISTDLKQVTARLPRQPPEYGICHGDVNISNLHLIDDERWALLDFEYFGYGWRLFDIGNFVNNQLYQLGQTEHGRGILDAFLQGYQSLRPLSQIELDVLPSFVMLRQIWLLGVGAKNLPNIGLGMFEGWLFEKCMPIIRAWMADPWQWTE